MSDGPTVWTGPWGFFMVFGWAIIGFVVYIALTQFMGRSGREISAKTEKFMAYGSSGVGILAWTIMWGMYGGGRYFWSNVSGSLCFLAAFGSLAGLAVLGDRVFANLWQGNCLISLKSSFDCSSTTWSRVDETSPRSDASARCAQG